MCSFVEKFVLFKAYQYVLLFFLHVGLWENNLLQFIRNEAIL